MAPAASCTHLGTIHDVAGEAAPSGPGCYECSKIGGRWVHLRRCTTCGEIGAATTRPTPTRPSTRARRGIPIIQSYEPGEDWYWCYPDELFFEIDSATPSPSHP